MLSACPAALLAEGGLAFHPRVWTPEGRLRVHLNAAAAERQAVAGGTSDVEQ